MNEFSFSSCDAISSVTTTEERRQLRQRVVRTGGVKLVSVAPVMQSHHAQVHFVVCTGRTTGVTLLYVCPACPPKFYGGPKLPELKFKYKTVCH